MPNYLVRLGLILSLTRATLCFLTLLLFACSQRLIEKGKLREINEYYENRVYVLKEEVKLSPQEVLRPGIPYRVYIESTPSLLKVKCYPAQETRESSVGKLVTYLENESVGKKQFQLDDVERLVNSKFELYDPKATKSKKK